MPEAGEQPATSETCVKLKSSQPLLKICLKLESSQPSALNTPCLVLRDSEDPQELTAHNKVVDAKRSF